MSKKLTPAIAKALAERVRAEVIARTKGTSEAIEKKIDSSKLYKELVLLVTKQRELEQKKSDLIKEIESTFSTKLNSVTISHYGHSERPSIYVREHSSASIDNIKDMILIEDYLSTGNETAEQLVDKLVKKLLTIK